MHAVLLVSLLLVGTADDLPPEPRLPLGKETTFVTGPLDKHGYIDYEAALNAALRQGITREKNANVALVQLMGPTPEGAELSPEYWKWLDIPPPPRGGDYFLGFGTFNERLQLTGEQLEALNDFQDRVTLRVWVPADCAPLAAWLAVNDKPLTRAREAVKRPEYFNPLVSLRKEGDPSNLIGALLPTVQRCREMGFSLAARATLRVGEKKFDEAWNDILACHRLGRLVGRGGTLIEGLVGIAVCRRASNATLVYLEHADLTAAQIRERLQELHALPPWAPPADKIALLERMSALDMLQLIRRGNGEGLRFIFDDNEVPTRDDLKALERLDWAPALQTVNRWYDRHTEALRIEDRARREKAFQNLEEELIEARKVRSPAAFVKLLASKDGNAATGKKVGDVLASLTVPAVRRVQQRQDQAVQVERNLHVAFALAAYRADTGRYPGKLADLAPRYLTAVPGDLFTGEALIYKPSAEGYLFYSVGPNGKDDGGRGPDDDPPGDDSGVRMPLPELKKK